MLREKVKMVRSVVSVTATLSLICASPVSAQYDERPHEQRESRFIHAGYFQRDFHPRYSNTAPDSIQMQYRCIMPTIGFRQGLVDVTFGYTRFTLRGEDRTSVFAGVIVGTEFPLTASPASALLIPVMLLSDYTRTDNTGPDKYSFNIGTVGFGTGLKYRLLARSFEFHLYGGQSAQIAFEGFRTGSGFSAITTGEALLIFRNALLLQGITVGYRFRYQTWNMNNAMFDYKSTSHGAFVGVMF